MKVVATEHDVCGKTETYVRYHCPGCKHDHAVPAAEWNWNGDVDKPTLHPSVRHFYTIPSDMTENGKPKEVTTCHYHVKSGKIEFCGDCQHELKGQTVVLPDIENA